MKLREHLDEQKPGAKITLLVPDLEAKLSYSSAQKYLQKLFEGLPGLPGIKESDLERVKNQLQTEIDIRLHNNWMLIKAIEELQGNL